MEKPRPVLVILANPPGALCLLFGISLLERLLRTVQRLGFQEAIIFSSASKEMLGLGRPSWARAGVQLDLRQLTGELRFKDISTCSGNVLLVSGEYYYDARLLETLAEKTTTTLLTDSDPTSDCAQLWSEKNSSAPGNISRVAAALLGNSWLSQQNPETFVLEQLGSDASARSIEECDAAQQPTYIVGLRKHVRPVFFPAPPQTLMPVAERFPRDRAQNGVLDIPGFLDSPIEDWIVKRLCQTGVRPNHITFGTMVIGLVVTLLFASGHLWIGVVLAFVIEVLDGVDGKLARTKVETTPTGEWEHLVDYWVELSWWTALAWHFHGMGLSAAYGLLFLLVGSDLVDRLAKHVVKKKLGRNLDDVANFDRFVRWIGSRRNINIWVLIVALALGNPANGFVFFCWWTAATTAAHVVRACQIHFQASA